MEAGSAEPPFRAEAGQGVDFKFGLGVVREDPTAARDDIHRYRMLTGRGRVGDRLARRDAERVKNFRGDRARHLKIVVLLHLAQCRARVFVDNAG